MPAAPEALRAALAGRYQVEREIGQGGMATVYLARDLKHHRLVAIKIVRPELATALGAERFLREIDTAASLTHPNILPLHDSGEAGGFLYFVMPYVEGESLRTRLAREAQLPLDDALQIAREVADALGHAHSRGIVHRDVKPANILLESGHAVVADFGIARAVSAAAGETLTETGSTLGTPAYMSPEQAAGSKHLDGRSDLYSLGCVLYEMLAGQPPFTGPTSESLVHQHLSAAPRLVTDLRPTVPAWVVAALQRALSKAPADRPSAAVFASTLAHHDSDAQAATPVPPAAQAAAVRRDGAGGAGTPRRRWIAAASGLLAVLAVGAALYAWRPWAAQTASAPPGHPRNAIAVLPFQNLSAEASNAYFAGGLHDELLTQLSKVAALRVISRTSVMGYEGTGRLRVHAQLIDAATDNHLWADTYDRTLDDAFGIQSDLAQQIVAAVGAALSSEERGRLAEAPTAKAEAYRLYLKGREYFRQPGYLRQNIESAQACFEQALALDPSFSLGHAALSLAHGRMWWFRYDPSESRAAAERDAAEKALRLAPDLPEAHVAMGRVHYQRRDWTRALDEYAVALEGLPNDGSLWA
ncbi:MAG: protein kinase, partial [Vicinamibacterales bacterium]|nr:protein kinase [Vicinamibacterales bacterium]